MAAHQADGSSPWTASRKTALPAPASSHRNLRLLPGSELVGSPPASATQGSGRMLLDAARDSTGAVSSNSNSPAPGSQGTTPSTVTASTNVNLSPALNEPSVDEEVLVWQAFAIKFDPTSPRPVAAPASSGIAAALKQAPRAAASSASELTYVPIPALPSEPALPAPASPPSRSPRLSSSSPAVLPMRPPPAEHPPHGSGSSSRITRHKSPARQAGERIVHPGSMRLGTPPLSASPSGSLNTSSDANSPDRPQRPIAKSRSNNALAAVSNDAVSQPPSLSSFSRGGGMTAFEALASLASVKPPETIREHTKENEKKEKEKEKEKTRSSSKREVSLSPSAERRGSPRSGPGSSAGPPPAALSSSSDVHRSVDIPDTMLTDYGALLTFCQLTLERSGSGALQGILNDQRLSTLWRVWLHAELGITAPLECLERLLPRSPLTELLERTNPMGSTLLDLALARDQAHWLAPMAAMLGRDRLRAYRSTNDEALFYSACAGGHVATVRWMLASGLATQEDVDADGPYKGESAFFQAVSGDHVAVVRLLLPLRPASLLRRNGESLSAVDMLYGRGSDAMFHEIHHFQWWSRARLLLYAHLRLPDNILARLPANVLYRLLSLLRDRGRILSLPL